MKKNLFVILIITVLLIAFVFIKDVNLDDSELTLEQIKEQLINTKEIYICNYSEHVVRPCSGNDLIRIESDMKVIKEFIDIAVTLEEFHGNYNKIKDNHTLYFVDENKDVLAVVDFGWHFIIKTHRNQYMLDPTHNEKLRELLDWFF